jgi:hypothetical protein
MHGVRSGVPCGVDERYLPCYSEVRVALAIRFKVIAATPDRGFVGQSDGAMARERFHSDPHAPLEASEIRIREILEEDAGNREEELNPLKSKAL